MKLKTFFPNYFKQQFKKQIWFMGIMAFLLFLALPISILIDMENMEQAQYLLEDKKYLFMMHALRSDMLYLWTLIGGVIAAIFQFRYLHSSKMVDFYHSLPVRKEKMYWMKLITVYLDFVIPYTVMIVLSLILGLSRGLMTKRALLAYFIVWILYQLMFLLIYAVSSIAMLLTGRIFVGVMGIGVFLFIPAVITSVMESYKSLFLQTYYGRAIEETRLYRLSPGLLPLEMRNGFVEMIQKNNAYTTSNIILSASLILFIVAFLSIGYYLMKKRPSEAAGNSMAFSVPARVIHVLLSIIGALFCGLFVNSMMYEHSMVWLALGVVTGGFLLYILIQFIYTMDFRKVLRYKWQLLVVELVSMGIAGLFYYDWIGFDTYLPEYDKLYSVALSIPDGNHYNGFYVDNEYITAEEYRMEHMNLAITEELYEMLEDAVDSSYSEGALHDETLSWICVRYKLQNGRERDRTYRIELKKYKELFASLYDQSEFKNVMMPIHSLWAEDGEYEISLKYQNEYVELFGLDQEKAREFVKVLEEDYDRLSGDSIVNEIPIAQLNIYMEHLKRTQDVYIYPSNTATINFLKESGYTMESRLTPENILKIEVEDYRLEETEEELKEAVTVVEQKVSGVTATASEEKVTGYTDPEQIAQMIPALLDNDVSVLWHDVCEDLYATVTYIGSDGYQMQIGCNFLEEELPEFLELE